MLTSIGSGNSPDYKKYWAKIEFDESSFSITDNCGGLERQIAIDYAFKMGRDTDDDRDNDVETIGMYGIGMKRAMFKMGHHCRVLTHAAARDHYQVTMDAKWMAKKAWSKIPLEDVPRQEKLTERGTKILVSELRPGISRSFVEPIFLKDLMDGLAEHFTTFLQRGFRITVNGHKITPARIEVLYAHDGVKPYFMKCNVGKTQVSIVMGLNPRAQDDSQGQRPAVTGWSVFCNDRAVLVGDTTRLTGWGETPIPRYHEQYDILTGIVEFRATDARDLPVTTTKRDLDASAEAWLVARLFMRKGTRKMVTHTNAWKNNRQEHRAFFKKAKSVGLEKIQDVFETGEESNLLKKASGTDGGFYLPDDLPMPETKSPLTSKISFSRPRKKIAKLAEALLDTDSALPKEVGEQCFDYAYRELIGR